MYCYDVIGYAYEGEIYCADCADCGDSDCESPIFAGDESADDLTCANCGCALAD